VVDIHNQDGTDGAFPVDEEQKLRRFECGDKPRPYID
jgi:hypothetical protein